MQRGILNHSLADIKRTVIEYCILPLGSEFVHKNSPLIKTVLLYGASGTGKTMLSHAIATETGSIFIDLSPSRILDAVNSSNGSNMDLKQLLLIVFRVRIL